MGSDQTRAYRSSRVNGVVGIVLPVLVSEGPVSSFAMAIIKLLGICDKQMSNKYNIAHTGCLPDMGEG
jgi:hypothetical protein